MDSDGGGGYGNDLVVYGGKRNSGGRAALAKLLSMTTFQTNSLMQMLNLYSQTFTYTASHLWISIPTVIHIFFIHVLSRVSYLQSSPFSV